MRQRIPLFLLVTIASFLAAGAAGQAAAPPPDWRRLQDLYVFKDYNPGGWAGSQDNNLEVENWVLPLDTAVTYHGLPSLRVNVTRDQTWWWVALVAIRGWATINLAQYYNHGFLEFNIKGAAGGERFYLALTDRANERAINGVPTESVEQTRAVTDFVTVTTDWQHVRVPLWEIINPASGFDLAQAWLVKLIGANPQPMKVWLNEIKFTSPDNERDYPAVKVNQVGYPARAEKYALVSGFDGVLTAAPGTAFQVRRAADSAVAYAGTLSLVTDYDPSVSGERVLKADFTPLETEGAYYLTVDVPGVAVSPGFRIGDDTYDALLVDACRYYYYQRANMALTPSFAGDYPHQAWHTQDFTCPLESNAAIVKDVSGGWYDAGDFGKYTNAGATAVNDLLWAYEMFGREFADGQFNIPESGNGCPDLLDEARYELEFILRMQDPATGGFYHRVFPQDKGGSRYISDRAGSLADVKPTAVTGSAVAALAHGYVIYKHQDRAFANAMLNAARYGWTYLEGHPALVPSPDGPYCDNDDANDRLWAAAELYRATGESVYGRYFLDNYDKFVKVYDQPENGHGVGGMEHMAFLAYMKADAPDPAAAAWFREKFMHWRSAILARAEHGTWRNTLDDDPAEDDYYWGSNMPALNGITVLYLGGKILDCNDKAVRRAAQSNLNYVLGVNPMAFSYVSGYGANSVSRIFSGIYSDDGKPGIPPGYMAGGANRYESRCYSRFSGKCYNDCNTEWTTNEHTIYWNSALVFNLALLAGKGRD